MKMEEQLNGYGGAIRWGLFKRAMEYSAGPSIPAPDWRALQNVKVTSYQPIFRDTFPSGKIVLQTVEIRYVRADDIVERTLTDEQRWRYDEEKGRWLLETGLPRFR
jgi:hypothetical protein